MITEVFISLKGRLLVDIWFLMIYVFVNLCLYK